MTRSSSLLFLAIALLIPAASITAGKPNHESGKNRLTLSGVSSAPVQRSPRKESTVKLVEKPRTKLARKPQAKLARELQMKPVEKPRATLAKKPQTKRAEKPQATLAKNPQTKKAEKPQVKLATKPQLQRQEQPSSKEFPESRSSKIKLLDLKIVPVVNTKQTKEPKARKIKPLTFSLPPTVSTETLQRTPPVFRHTAEFHDKPLGTVVLPVETVVAPPVESASEYSSEGCQDDCHSCRPRIVKHHLRDIHHRYGGYHQTYRERPFGTYVCHMIRRQIGVGMADSMMLYDYDFHHGAASDKLTSRGIYQLKKFAQRSRIFGLPIVIESALGKPDLNQARHESVIAALKVLDPTATEDWVVVGTPNPAGLSGDDAILIDQTQLLQTQSRGTYAPIDTGGISSGNSDSSDEQ